MRPMVAKGVLVALIPILIAMSIAVASAGEQEQKQDGIRQIMREKLKHSQFLIEGLAEEDFP
jgi:hypothetical protein